MKPTTEFRWLKLNLGSIGQNHPSAKIIDGTNWAIVLQQKWFGTFIRDGEEVAGDEWRDIPIENFK